METNTIEAPKSQNYFGRNFGLLKYFQLKEPLRAITQTPKTTNIVPKTVLSVIFSSLFKKICAKNNVIKGFIANIGDTTTKGALLKAKYINKTPAAENTPDKPKNKKLFLDDFFKSVAICLENIIETYINPNRRANAVATIGGAYSVVICLPRV